MERRAGPLETGAVIPSELSWDVVTLEGEQGRGVSKASVGRGNGRQRAESPLWGSVCQPPFQPSQREKKQGKIPANLPRDLLFGNLFQSVFPCLSPLSSPFCFCLSPLFPSLSSLPPFGPITLAINNSIEFLYLENTALDSPSGRQVFLLVLSANPFGS